MSGNVTVDLEQLTQAVNESAKLVRTLMLAMLAACAYVVAAVGSVTDADVLIGRGVELPILGTSLPLPAFLATTCVLLVVLHANMLVQTYLLAEKQRHLEDRLADPAMLLGSREDVRQTLFPLLLRHGLERDLARRPRSMRSLLWGINLLVFVTPVVTLVFVQLASVSLQNDAVLWTQRVSLAVDLFVVGAIWPCVRAGRWGHDWLRWRPWAPAPALVALLLASWIVIDYPRSDLAGRLGLIDWLRSHNQWRLRVLGRDFTEKPLDLTGRSLRGLHVVACKMPGSVFVGADLRRAVFEDVDLSGADFSDRRFQPAFVGDEHPTPTDLAFAQFRNASLEGARLGGADLRSAKLIGAQMRGASLRDAILLAADLSGADLTGADLTGAECLGTRLSRARLICAFVGGEPTRFWEAELNEAVLELAGLYDADLRSADLRGIRWLGASIDGARIDSLYDAARLERVGVGLAGSMTVKVERQPTPHDVAQWLDDPSSYPGKAEWLASSDPWNAKWGAAEGTDRRLGDEWELRETPRKAMADVVNGITKNSPHARDGLLLQVLFVASRRHDELKEGLGHDERPFLREAAIADALLTREDGDFLDMALSDPRLGELLPDAAYLLRLLQDYNR